jgi:arginase
MQKTIHMIGYKSDIAAAQSGTKDGPVVLRESSFLKKLAPLGLELTWDAMIESDDRTFSKYELVAKRCELLGTEIEKLVQNKEIFTVVGGDHSCAIGTWSGVYAALRKPIGLIWIDAHMDSHIPATTPSGNIHGMPLAALLGHGNPLLANVLVNAPKLQPEHICLIGVRSFEKGEEELLKELKVRIFFMDEIEKRGLDDVMQEAMQIVTQGTAGYGISIDIDAIDPQDAPGTGVAEENGIRASDLCQALQIVGQQANFLGAEIAEFDPHRDKDQITEKLIPKLVGAIMSGKIPQ